MNPDPRTPAEANTPAAEPAARQTSELELFCPRCSYSLRGIESERCPECGYDLDFAKLAEAQMPWAHRGEQLGRLRAFLATAWMVIRHPRRLREEVHRPVSERDARRFRWMIALFAYAVTAIAIMLVWVLTGGSIEAWPQLAVAHYYALTFMYLATGAPAYAYGNKHRPPLVQARAAALSYYAASPLTLLPIGFALTFVLVLLSAGTRPLVENLLITAAVLSSLAPFGIWMHRLVQLARSTLHLHGWPLNRWVIKLLGYWAAAAIVPWLVLGAIAYVALVVISLRF